MTEIAPIVLLVDEQRLIQKGVQKLLASAPDIELYGCTEATEAVAMAEQHGPTVILQDLNMPDIHGLELLDTYRKHPYLAEIPVIILSGTNSVEVKADAFARGADDYIVKMPHQIELIARIRHHSKAYIEHLEREAALETLEREKKKLAAANRELERLSSVDGLTGIANRRHFDSAFEREWGRAIREGKPISLILSDVDHFKQYNDHYGHQAGDACLQQVSRSMAELLLRPADLLARYGGEEFVMLLPGTDAAGAMIIAERCREQVLALQLPHARSAVHDCVSISMGVATVRPQRNSLASDLLRSADVALYQAKAAGRNRVLCSG